MKVLAGEALFDRPHRVVRGYGRDEALAGLSEAELALANGYWIAGYLTYDWELALGVFDKPSLAPPPRENHARHSPLLPAVARLTYERRVGELQDAIYDGNVYQVNYTIPFALETTCDTRELFEHYAAGTGARYQLYVEDGERAILSWSPELFLHFDGARLRTRPMKGTAPLEAVDELFDAKNRAEHVMIVDLLRNDLHRVCDEVEVEAFLTVERYPTFVTMTSTIAGDLRPGVGLADVFAATFPCGSITGAPKLAAMRYIDAVEERPRGAYCGTIGFLSPDRKGWFNVAIRTAQIDRSTGIGRFDAGGGIVADSVAAREWEEIELKSRFLRAPQFAILETFDGGADEATCEAHLTRLETTARALGVPFDGDWCTRAFRKSQRGHIVRLRLYSDGRVETSAEIKGDLDEPVRVCMAEGSVRSENRFLAHKTSWRPAHDAAAAYARSRNCFDAILRNERDEITEGARTNVYAEIDGALWTPPRSAGLLPGILRERLVSEGRARERTLLLDDLRRAGAVYVGNSARGLLRAQLVTT